MIAVVVSNDVAFNSLLGLNQKPKVAIPELCLESFNSLLGLNEIMNNGKFRDGFVFLSIPS